MAAITSAVISFLSFIMSVTTYVVNQYGGHPDEKKYLASRKKDIGLKKLRYKKNKSRTNSPSPPEDTDNRR